MRREQRARILIAAGVILLSALVFVCDLAFEKGLAAGVWYGLAVLLSLWLPRHRDTLVVALGTTGLTTLGFALSTAGDEPWRAFLERSAALLTIWAVALLGLQQKRMREAAAAQREELAAKNRQERNRLETRLRQAEKMEAVGQLAGGIAHDFNNLLTVITGFAELAREKLSSDNPARSDLERVLEAVDKAADLTRQLLSFSRQRVLRPRALNLNTVVAEFKNLLERTIPESIEIRTLLDPALGTSKADPGQVEQVLLNLAVNARDAMPDGGKLTIETKNADFDETCASVQGVMAPGRYVMLSLADTGIGIDEETQKHIFEPFFTTKEGGKGTGLGLATTYAIVKQSGGYIWVYSELGQGTTFKIYLPRLEEATEPPQSTEVAVASSQGSERLLLVEDDEQVRHLAARILEDLGYSILESGNSEDALRISAKTRGRIDLLLTDRVLPGMSGQDLAEAIVASHPDCRVVYMSGYSQDTGLRADMRDGRAEFLEKPFNSGALARKVRLALDRAR